MATKTITDASFSDDVLGANGAVLVDFWAPWCGPCKMISPALEEIAGEMAGKVDIAKMNIDDNPDTPGQYGIRSIPTLMIFKDGELVSTKVGAAGKADLAKWIEETVA